MFIGCCESKEEETSQHLQCALVRAGGAASADDSPFQESYRQEIKQKETKNKWAETGHQNKSAAETSHKRSNSFRRQLESDKKSRAFSLIETWQSPFIHEPISCSSPSPSPSPSPSRTSRATYQIEPSNNTRSDLVVLCFRMTVATKLRCLSE